MNCNEKGSKIVGIAFMKNGVICKVVKGYPSFADCDIVRRTGTKKVFIKGTNQVVYI